MYDLYELYTYIHIYMINNYLSDGVVERLLGEVAGAVGGVQDLVVEDGEVEREAWWVVVVVVFLG
jgi:hypothetical protein